jgi:pimeloyl-ACP methyl ester carboxylesterase
MRTVRIAALLLAGAVACRGPHPERPPGSCTHVQAVRELRGIAMCEDAWTCTRPPGGPFDRIGLHRLAACEGATGPVVLYLPGMHMNGELPIVDPRYDLRVYLAAAGVRTWGLDYRTHAVPAQASPDDLGTLRRWTSEVFVDDAAWAAGFVRGADRGPFYLAGFSRGAAFAYELASRADQGLAGLVILDGMAGSGGAGDGARGGPAIDVGGSRLPFPERERLLSAVIGDPRAPSPMPGFPSAGTALAELLYSAPSFGGHGGLSSARDGTSDVQIVATLLRSYDRWWPRAALDAPAPERPKRPIPVLAFASTNMGPAWVERVRASAGAYGEESAAVRELPLYGHLDVLVARRAAQDVFEPARAWIEARPPRP